MSALSIRLLVCAWSSFALVGCFLDDEHRDCHEVCDAYDDCFGPIPEDACSDRCEDIAERDEFYDDRLERCADCVDFATCTEIVDFCEAECEGIVFL